MKTVIFICLIVTVGLVWGLFPVVSETTGFDLSEYGKQSSEGAGMSEEPDRYESAVVGGGCFWCVEAVYERIEGVVDAVSGYAGGHVENPTYNQVTAGRTGHAEVVRVSYDPKKTSYEEILAIFFKSHDPTTQNRQGADRGTQYRSIVLYENDSQREISENVLSDSQQFYSDPIVTEIVPLEAFYEAEEYHQDYFEVNPYAGYCQLVIAPKLKKLGLEGAAMY